MSLNVASRRIRGTIVNARDPVYNSLWLQKFMNSIMRDGKKSKVENMTMRVFRNLKFHNPFPAATAALPQHFEALPHAAAAANAAAAPAPAAAAGAVVITNGPKKLTPAVSALQAPLTPLDYTAQHVHPLIPFYHVMQNLQLMVYTHPSKVGARVHNVPYLLDAYQQYRLPLNWLVRAVKDGRGGESSQQRMEREFRNILKRRSPILQKKMDVYKTVMDNRAFMHFRWLY